MTRLFSRRQAIAAMLASCLLSRAALAQRPEPPLQPHAGEPPRYVVFFDMGKAIVGPREAATIREAAVAARQRGVTVVEVTGHTDRAGSDRGNEALSLRRARAVRDMLVRHGVPQDIIIVRGLGETQPFMATEDGGQAPENRRVEIVIR